MKKELIVMISLMISFLMIRAICLVLFFAIKNTYLSDKFYIKISLNKYFFYDLIVEVIPPLVVLNVIVAVQVPESLCAALASLIQTTI